MTNPLSLSQFRNSSLRILKQIAERQIYAASFWLELCKACEQEQEERLKLQSERCEVPFELPDLTREETAICRNELAVLIDKLEKTTADDDALVLFLSAAGMALGAQLKEAASAN